MSVMRGSNLNIANILAQVIQPMRNRLAGCQRGPVMVVDLDGGLGIEMTRSIEVTYQLLFLLSMLITG